MPRMIIFCGTNAALKRYEAAGIHILRPDTFKATFALFCADPNGILATSEYMIHGWRAPPGTFVTFDRSWPYEPQDRHSVQAEGRVGYDDD